MTSCKFDLNNASNSNWRYTYTIIILQIILHYYLEIFNIKNNLYFKSCDINDNRVFQMEMVLFFISTLSNELALLLLLYIKKSTNYK